ncbi:MAG: MFS transporter [Acidobacteria bacterium 13_1_20CM_2_65_9]|nr:MAG: MFS transporter [Acidobacteria bacterium 13_1_20CM_2_65_9]
MRTVDDAERKRQIVRAVVAAAVGTSIEWYDFFLYGVAAALVFPQKFFPGSDPYTGSLLSFSTYFVGFAARPVGAAIFGHIGDRVGRKSSLIATLLLMGISTACIGLVPGYDRIGIWGGVLLTIFRALQGIGVGGEWGGSVLLTAEWGEGRRRGFLTSWTQFAAPAGMVLANGALAAMTAISGDAFLDWGWRIPFLLSFVLVGIGFYIRTGILETPVFARIQSEGRVERTPVGQVLRHNWREVILTALLRTGQQTPFYIFTTYVLTYGTQVLGFSRGLLLNFVMLQALVSMCDIPLFGHLSDSVGRRRMTAVGCFMMIIFPFLYFSLLDTRRVWLAFLAIMLALPIQDLQYAPQAALIAESFPGRLRYSGASLGYQLASITAGGPAPIVALWLFQRYHTSTAVAAYMSASAIVSLIALRLLPDRSSTELDAD